MKIYIPHIDFVTINRKSIFILARPFWSDIGWTNTASEKQLWNISEDHSYTEDISKAEVYFIPKPVNSYSKIDLESINAICSKFNIKAYGYISGDFGEDFGRFQNIYFFRMGGFKMQLSQNNKGFPVALSDHFQRIYKEKEIDVRAKQFIPTVGFCGHSDLSQIKRLKEYAKFLKENLKRFLKRPFREDYESLFASAFQRAKLLKSFENSDKIITNFIYRKHYRAGAISKEEREKTTLEYYDNIKNSDYVLCVRGAGNFSVRLYETLMMGRIPIFINTDCLLPFEDKIQWDKHILWIEWENRKNVAELVADFHQKISEKDFEMMQLENRKLWKEGLSVGNILNIIKDGI
ncbi:exostosin domain-containing protein [Flavobacterium sp. PLA-1-15]|uniref:exostosin domain-containing protein n=1 Tax=Flavobacterium sp. PLA-1-15 TaxID=3380533 RepID=UPI003B7C869E